MHLILKLCFSQSQYLVEEDRADLTEEAQEYKQGEMLNRDGEQARFQQNNNSLAL